MGNFSSSKGFHERVSLPLATSNQWTTPTPAVTRVLPSPVNASADALSLDGTFKSWINLAPGTSQILICENVLLSMTNSLALTATSLPSEENAAPWGCPKNSHCSPGISFPVLASHSWKPSDAMDAN